MDKRLTPSLRRQVLELPMQDRLAMLEELRVSIRLPELDPHARLSFLADKMMEVSGVDVRRDKERNVGAVWPRYLFIFIARREGYSQATIGKMIGRDHSSVCAAERRVKEAFSVPDAYKNEINLYNKFVESL